ncbi:hypothetical protein BDN67DRAFT_976220 [Paxillus ammoniavirescens]|nr:hypothetical protein BDN67DRAFT_976220 [Paxillus ammoniavirescens]
MALRTASSPAPLNIPRDGCKHSWIRILYTTALRCDHEDLIATGSLIFLKADAVTFLRGATGYGAYFLVYANSFSERLHKKGSAATISSLNSILCGAAVGYGLTDVPGVMGSDKPNRHDQISNADWLNSHLRPVKITMQRGTGKSGGQKSSAPSRVNLALPSSSR